MKTAIIYYSKHHQNTQKVIEAMAENNDITLIDVLKYDKVDLSEYDLIGFASGIYFSKFHKSVAKFAEENLLQEQKVFFVYTCGAKKESYTKQMKAIAAKKSAIVLGEYGCLGFDTYGPFKLMGGIAKGHPDFTDLTEAAKFYESIENKA